MPNYSKLSTSTPLARYPLAGSVQGGGLITPSHHGRSIQTQFDVGKTGMHGRYISSEEPITTVETTDNVLQTRNALFFNAATAMGDVMDRRPDLSCWGDSQRPGDACTVFQFAALVNVPKHQVSITAANLCQPRVTATANGLYPATAIKAPLTVGEAYIRYCDVNTSLVFAGVARDFRRYERLSKVKLAANPAQDQPTEANSERCVAAGVMGTFTLLALAPGNTAKTPAGQANSPSIVRCPRPRFSEEIDGLEPWNPLWFSRQIGIIDKHIKPGVVPFSMDPIERCVREDVHDAFTCASLIYRDIRKCVDNGGNIVRGYEPMFIRGTAFPSVFVDMFKTAYDSLIQLLEIQFMVEYVVHGNVINGSIIAKYPDLNIIRVVYDEYRKTPLTDNQSRSLISHVYAFALHLFAQTNDRAAVLAAVKDGHLTRIHSVRRYIGDFMVMSYTNSKREASGYVLRQ